MAAKLPDPCWTERAGECVSCGYSLEGLPAPGVCPECGAEYESRQLVLAGVPHHARGGSKARLAAWIVIGTVAVIHSQTWMLWITLRGLWWTVPLAITAAVAGAIVLMLATNRRERSGTERFVITPAGVWRISARADPNDTAQGSILVRWEGANRVTMKRHGPVWRRMVVRRTSPPGKDHRPEAVVFDAGIRCPDAVEGEVIAAIEQCMWRGRESDRKQGES